MTKAVDSPGRPTRSSQSAMFQSTQHANKQIAFNDAASLQPKVSQQRGFGV